MFRNRRAQAAHALDIAARLFDTNDFRAVGGQTRHGPNTDLHAAAPGNAVEDHRKTDRFGHRPVVPVEALLGGFVVIGGDEQGGIRPEGFRLPRERDGFGGAVRSGAGDDLAASGGGIDRHADHFGMFFVGEGRGFARCSDGHDPVDPRRNLPPDVRPECRLVKRAPAKRCHQSRVCPPECHASPHSIEIVPSKTKSAGPSRMTSENVSPFL